MEKRKDLSSGRRRPARTHNEAENAISAPDAAAVYDLLYRLGITANYTGFFHSAYAVCLVLEQPERLLLVTKWLYPEVARHYATTPGRVERNIRTAAAAAWERNPQLLSELAGCELARKPTNAQFLAILSRWFFRPRAA